jgi:hypothetical protein
MARNHRSPGPVPEMSQCKGRWLSVPNFIQISFAGYDPAMVRSGVLAAAIAAFALSGCGSVTTASTPATSSTATQTQSELKEKFREEADKELAQQEQTSHAATLEDSAEGWDRIEPDDQTRLAAQFLKGAGRKYAREGVKVAPLLTEIETDEQKGIADNTENISHLLDFAAGLVAADHVSHQKRLYLNHGLVGKSTSTVRGLLGAPDHTQEIAGHVFWYYDSSQLVIEGGVVTQVNRY